MPNMIQVMLVDDEYLALEDLKTLIDWEALGFHISAAARSGRAALRLFDSQPVDLIITDISMPNMDGITLIEQIKKKYPAPLFLLLTAYAEIDYMKRAFQSGVEDYLIKDEITPEILSSKLSDIRDKYMASRRLSYSFLQKNLTAYFGGSKNPFPAELSALPKNNLLYCILIPDIIFPMIDEFFLAAKPSAAQMISVALPLTENYQQTGINNLCSIAAYNNKLLLLLHVREISSLSDLRQTLHHFSQNLIHQLKSSQGLSFSCFYSCTPMNLLQLHDDYFCRQKSIRARYFLGSSTAEALDSGRLYITNEKPDFTEENFIDILKNPDCDLSEYISEQFALITAKHNYIGLSHLINTCFSFFMRWSDSLTADPSAAVFTDISGIRSFILAAAGELEKKNLLSCSRETKKAISYLMQNYGRESLSIREVADEVGLSATHFSRTFKTETGQTVWDYLTDIRIQKACRILTETDAKIYEIAEMTGYSSPQYFSQVFLKQKGMKPLDYRRKEQT